ncbi:MAG: FG-GAP-like repeat-containing protein, partial [Anaerolineae bacterium]
MNASIQPRVWGRRLVAPTAVVVAVALACLSPVASDRGAATARTLVGAGLFIDSGQRLGRAAAMAVALGDLDRNGSRDAFVGNGAGYFNRVWLNNGQGFFRDSGQLLGVANTTAVALGDLDRDGDLDAVEGNYGEPSRFWWNDGRGNFSLGIQTLPPMATNALALGDLDADGDLD